MKLVLWLVISFLPGLFGGRFQPGAWYETLPKAPWTPPKWAFPVVWTSLYVLIGISSWLVFRNGLRDQAGRLSIFVVQLVLNALWSWIFFGRHQIGWALAELAVLWIAAAIMTVSFAQISTLAGELLIPYLVWLTVAFSLNGYIWLKTRAR